MASFLNRFVVLRTLIALLLFVPAVHSIDARARGLRNHLRQHFQQQFEYESALPLNIMFVVDKSGSIGSQGFESSKAFLTSAIETGISVNSKVGLISFSSEVTLESPLVLDHHAVIEKANSMSWSRGYTWTRQGVEKAITEFQQESNGYKNLLLLLTDGIPDGCVYYWQDGVKKQCCKCQHSKNYFNPCGDHSAFDKSVQQTLADEDISVYIIGVGYGFRIDALQCLLEKGDEYVEVDSYNANALYTAFGNIDLFSSTRSPTESLSTAGPTNSPSTQSPTASLSTASPTEPPSTASPTEPPSTASPTEPPSTAGPTDSPSTAGPTDSPSTAGGYGSGSGYAYGSGHVGGECQPACDPATQYCDYSTMRCEALGHGSGSGYAYGSGHVGGECQPACDPATQYCDYSTMRCEALGHGSGSGYAYGSGHVGGECQPACDPATQYCDYSTMRCEALGHGSGSGYAYGSGHVGGECQPACDPATQYCDYSTMRCEALQTE